MGGMGSGLVTWMGDILAMGWKHFNLNRLQTGWVLYLGGMGSVHVTWMGDKLVMGWKNFNLNTTPNGLGATLGWDGCCSCDMDV